MAPSRSRPPLLESLHFEPLAFSQPQETGAISSQPAGLEVSYNWLLTASPDLVHIWFYGLVLFITRGMMAAESNRPRRTQRLGCW
jgi:hypothetical protein